MAKTSSIVETPAQTDGASRSAVQAFRADGSAAKGPLSAATTSTISPKLHPPQRLAAEVPRVALCERIFAAGEARLVLLRAPAGFGKTTAMLQVRERFQKLGVPTTWLTLDRGDNDLVRFLGALSAALASVVPGLPAVDGHDGRGLDRLALSLIDGVASHSAPFALFCDDFEAVHNPVALAFMGELIDRLPRGAQVIIGSRGVPDLGLGRLRVSGRLLDVEPAHLRFTEAEVDGFLRQQRGIELTAADIRRLHTTTEGWAAALRLASLSLERREEPGRFIAGFSGSNSAVVGYLAEDVLARQSPDLRDFLLRTSLLAELNPSLCDAVCGRQDSASLLRLVDQAQLFLTPLQGDRGQYRYHGMFAEFLRGELVHLMPQEVPRIHRTAASWFAAQGRPMPAIEHALAAADLAFALPLLTTHAQTLLAQGRVRLLSRWLGPLLDSGRLEGHPMLQVVHAWSVFFARGPRAAEPLLERLEARADADATVRAHCLAMRPLFLMLSDRIDEALPIAEAVQAQVPPDLSFVSGFLEVTRANLALISGRYQEALRLVDVARAQQPSHSSDLNLALSEAVEAVVNMVQGRLRQAIAGLRLATSAGATDATRATNGNVLAGVPLALALYESGQLEQSERLLAIYIPLTQGVCVPDELIVAHVVMARILIERQQTEGAEQLLMELERIGHRKGLARVIASARLERVRLLLLQDRLAHAREALDRCGSPSLWAHVARLSYRANEVETFDVLYARWAIRAGQHAEVLPGLHVELAAARRTQRERRALTLTLLIAQALYRDGQRNKAMRQLATALTAASREGYVRAVLDEGSFMVQMCAELRAQHGLFSDGHLPGEVLSFLDVLVPQQSKWVLKPVDAATPTEAPALNSELLSRRELQVLRLAAEGLSNLELAEKLFLGETTVRTHLRNINGKLDTRSRMEAIAVARRRGLIA
ncbi:LuxR family transcriptional regulator [Hydrogenophaga sp. YM1]|uniref:LuxR C-terminal-related transcriptional regulator n=1 Tax=Hydrogenophaga sp. YM1 TaxID=2806262 RepID=UPI001955F8BE|nr:LuxR C-terminal-related transcriptional regulator [Hydrogenophaga sp. YM1]QRR34007.1 LuxR family transcriptional regulator [Hydrogenophaga sp. YM1]